MHHWFLHGEDSNAKLTATYAWLTAHMTMRSQAAQRLALEENADAWHAASKEWAPFTYGVVPFVAAMDNNSVQQAMMLGLRRGLGNKQYLLETEVLTEQTIVLSKAVLHAATMFSASKAKLGKLYGTYNKQALQSSESQPEASVLTMDNLSLENDRSDWFEENNRLLEVAYDACKAQEIKTAVKKAELEEATNALEEKLKHQGKRGEGTHGSVAANVLGLDGRSWCWAEAVVIGKGNERVGTARPKLAMLVENSINRFKEGGARTTLCALLVPRGDPLDGCGALRYLQDGTMPVAWQRDLPTAWEQYRLRDIPRTLAVHFNGSRTDFKCELHLFSEAPASFAGSPAFCGLANYIDLQLKRVNDKVVARVTNFGEEQHHAVKSCTTAITTLLTTAKDDTLTSTASTTLTSTASTKEEVKAKAGLFLQVALEHVLGTCQIPHLQSHIPMPDLDLDRLTTSIPDMHDLVHLLAGDTNPFVYTQRTRVPSAAAMSAWLDDVLEVFVCSNVCASQKLIEIKTLDLAWLLEITLRTTLKTVANTKLQTYLAFFNWLLPSTKTGVAGSPKEVVVKGILDHGLATMVLHHTTQSSPVWRTGKSRVDLQDFIGERVTALPNYKLDSALQCIENMLMDLSRPEVAAFAVRHLLLEKVCADKNLDEYTDYTRTEMTAMGVTNNQTMMGTRDKKFLTLIANAKKSVAEGKESELIAKARVLETCFKIGRASCRERVY
jgi:hypothetical protein